MQIAEMLISLLFVLSAFLKTAHSHNSRRGSEMPLEQKCVLLVVRHWVELERGIGCAPCVFTAP